jgi:hypothetical protein
MMPVSSPLMRAATSPGKARPVFRRPRDFRLQRAPAPRVLIVVLLAMLVLGGIGGVPANGATLTAGAGHAAGRAEHHLYCKCATHCRGDSCCCGPDASRVEPPARMQQHFTAGALALGTHTDRDQGPCMGAAPCDGRGPTTPTPIVRIVDTAALMDGLALLTKGPSVRLAPAPADRLPTVEQSRLDEPPELTSAL